MISVFSNQVSGMNMLLHGHQESAIGRYILADK
jgi:hypothetical protein